MVEPLSVGCPKISTSILAYVLTTKMTQSLLVCLPEKLTSNSHIGFKLQQARSGIIFVAGGAPWIQTLTLRFRVDEWPEQIQFRTKVPLVPFGMITAVDLRAASLSLCHQPSRRP